MTACIGLLAALSVSSVASAPPASRQGTVTLTTAQAEGMVRDRIMSERSGETTHPFTDENLVAAFAALVNGLAPAR